MSDGREKLALRRAMMQWVLEIVGLIVIVIAAALAMAGWREVARLTMEVAHTKANVDLLAQKGAENEVSIQSLTTGLAELRQSIGAEVAQLQNELAKVAESTRETGAAETEQAAAEIAAATAGAAELDELRQWADRNFTAAAADAARTSQQVGELGRYTVGRLEHEAAGTKVTPKVLRCGVYAQQPAVVDIVPVLLDDLRAALGLEPLYGQPDGPQGVKSFVRWPGDQPSPELRLSSLLRDAIGDAGSGEAGTEELRALLLALGDSGPAFVQFGPLVVAATDDLVAAGFVPASWAGLTSAQRQEAVTGSSPDLLGQLGATGITDLSRWVIPQAA
jgi:hypothetical protein